MKSAVLIVCLAAFVAAKEYYASLDNFNISDVHNNERLLVAYTSNCLIDKGPCTPELKKLKDKLPEALETHCAKCTDKQKQLVKKLVQELKSRHPDLWKKLVAKYDPTGKYHQWFQGFLNN